MTVFEIIKSLADKQGKNVKTVALDIGLSENAIYGWKKTKPKAEDLAKVADYFRVSVDYLLGREKKADYKFNGAPFLVETIKHNDGKFEIKTKHLTTVDTDLLQEINLARAKVLGSMNEYAENNKKSGQYTEFRIEQFFIDELIERGVEVIKLKESPKPIDLKKVISEKKPTSWDDPRIDWNEWVSFDGEPISDDVKKMLFAIYGDKLTD
jgi:transcriptional regulator with XRE-family HTH domain